MAQEGYINCSGCGRLFKNDDVVELIALQEHDCDWDDERLDEFIGELKKDLHA